MCLMFFDLLVGCLVSGRAWCDGFCLISFESLHVFIDWIHEHVKSTRIVHPQAPIKEKTHIYIYIVFIFFIWIVCQFVELNSTFLSFGWCYVYPPGIKRSLPENSAFIHRCFFLHRQLRGIFHCHIWLADGKPGNHRLDHPRIILYTL